MPEIVRHGLARWPGVDSLVSLQVTIGHGLTPSTAELCCLPQAKPPARTGDLEITDGVESLTLVGCKLDDVVVRGDMESGFIWSLTIVDRRWQWRLGTIEGAYNQLDENGKLWPLTIRSPRELMELCLEQMNEEDFVIEDEPPGLEKQDGINWEGANPPWLRVTPTTGTNPSINWEAGSITPAAALDQLCHTFGLRLVYQPLADRILITKLGNGDDLPGGSISRLAPSLKDPETPSGCGIVGAPTRYQVRLLLEAVGLEWHGADVPIDRLSYRPQIPGAKQISRVTILNPGLEDRYQVFLGAGDDVDVTTGFLAEHEVLDAEGAASVAADLADKINDTNDPKVKGILTATTDGNVLILTGVRDGVAFRVFARVDSDPPEGGVAVALAQAPVDPISTWDYCFPPQFADVRATDRLTYYQAVAQAQKGVFKRYRLADVGPAGQRMIPVPGFEAGDEKVRRRFQLLPEEDQVELVVPEAADAGLLDRNGEPAVKNFYNGYARYKPAAVYGSIGIDIDQLYWRQLGAINTKEDKQVFVDFRIDSRRQVLIFDGYVYRWSAGMRIKPAKLILQTAVQVRDEDTHALDCYRLSRPFPDTKGTPAGDTPYAWRRCDDVQLNMIGKYNARNQPIGAERLEIDAKVRGKYYLIGLEAQYLTSVADTREYNGIRAIELDGAIQQVTWHIGESGCSTTASRNTEHSVYVAPYPARRRQEFLDPVRQQAILNAGQNPRIGPEMYTPGGGGG